MTMSYSRLLFFFYFIFFISSSFAQKQGISIEKTAAWIDVLTTNYSPEIDINEIQDGYYYLLGDQQKNVEEKISYSHIAMKIISEAGVENASQVSIEYNPEYEKLLLHTVELIRDGKHINKLNLSKFKTLQRETDLERNIYDGTYTAVLILDDVRKGDVIEYSYSIKGKNPIYSEKFSTSFYSQYSVPLGELNQRIICNSSRKLKIKEFNNTIKPVIKTEGGKTIYQWHTVNIKPLISDDNIPKWFDPYAYSMVSEFENWKDVKDWAKNLFVLNEPLSKELKDSLRAIENRYSTIDEKIIAVIRIVQNQVRYMGIEIGVYSHLPNTPNKVFSQRFGDCKDKSQLLCALLKAIGVEAHPVLINTILKDEMLNVLPNPQSFNHCTVQIKLNRSTYWVDPTISYQCGNLCSNAYPDYRWGLVVTDNSEKLTPINLVNNGAIRITEEFEIPDFTSPTNLTVNTIYEGDEADIIRYQIANASIKELEDNYKNFYAKLYPKIRLRDSLKLVDYPNLNKYTITEYYSIDDLWVDIDSLKKREKIKSNFEALLIESYIYLPKIRIRKMPISIRYPTNIHQTILIKLPEEWNVTAESGKLSTSGYDYTYDYRYFDKTITLNYNYSTKKDFIATEEVDEYIRTVDKIYDHTTYALTYDKTAAVNENKLSGTSKTNWSLVLFILFYSSVISYVFYRLYFINIGEQPPENVIEPIPSNFGGWIILVLIGLVIRPFGYLIQLFTSNYFNADNLNSLSSKNEFFTFAYTYEVIGIVTMFFFSVFLLILFLSYRNSLPRFYIIFLILCLVYVTIDSVIANVLLEKSVAYSYGNIIGTIIGCAIWIPYFLISQRVKETFVVRYKIKK